MKTKRVLIILDSVQYEIDNVVEVIQATDNISAYDLIMEINTRPVEVEKEAVAPQGVEKVVGKTDGGSEAEGVGRPSLKGIMAQAKNTGAPLLSVIKEESLTERRNRLGVRIQVQPFKGVLIKGSELLSTKNIKLDSHEPVEAAVTELVAMEKLHASGKDQFIRVLAEPRLHMGKEHVRITERVEVYEVKNESDQPVV